MLEQVKDRGQSESGDDDDMQPAHRRAMTVRAFHLPGPHFRSALMAIPDHCAPLAGQTPAPSKCHASAPVERLSPRHLFELQGASLKG